MARQKSVNEIIERLNFSEELRLLREIVLSTELEETVKWGMPAYTYNGKTLIGIGSFKAHFGVWFHQGALLKDAHGKLINAQEGKTKALRQWRMTSAADIQKRILRSYILETIQNEKDDVRIGSAKPIKKAPKYPPMLKEALDGAPKFKAAFTQLTPGKQREYCSYISEAKREATKHSRIEKIKPMVLKGIGLNDKYQPKR
jgi:uncharacterized protein YdeI (YjbR/CyaY-like superfamily)